MTTFSGVATSASTTSHLFFVIAKSFKIAAYGIFAIAASSHAADLSSNISNKSSANCGGLFLLHMSDKQFSIRECGISDSLGIGNLSFYGGYNHLSLMSRYSDKWDLKGTNKLDIGSAGIEGRYKYITLNASINSLPFIRSSIGVYRPDSLLFAKATIARGSPKIGEIRWISEKETDIVHEISVDWQTHFLYWGVDAGSKFGNHQLGASYGYFMTNPRNPQKEHYVRDSIRAFYISGDYKGSFAKDTIQAFYAFANADITLFGIAQQESSRKRFLYLPIEASLHLAEAKWKRKDWRAHLGFFHISGETNSNPDRFFETLAANRALPTSVLKSLSFAFLQKTFRVDADLSALGFLGGATYQTQFGHNFKISPKVNLDGYFAAGETNISKKSETTSLISLQSYIEENNRQISSFGSVLTLGCELSRGNLALEYSIMQLIPFHISYKENLLNEPASEKKEDKSKEHSDKGRPSHDNPQAQEHNSIGEVPNKMSAIFRNGFATSLSIIFRI